MTETSTLEIAYACARAALDKKAENLRILNLEKLSGFTDYFVVCGAYSERQVQAIADSIQSTLKQEGHEVISVEGYNEGRWIVIDCGDVVAHVFMDAIREFYNLEGLWADAPRVPVPSEYYGVAASRLN